MHAPDGGNDQPPNFVPNNGNNAHQPLIINNNYDAPQQQQPPTRSVSNISSTSHSSYSVPSTPPITSQRSPATPRPSNATNAGIIVANRAGDEETEDGRIRNREAATKIRDAWIYKQIRARQDEFTQYKQGRIFVGTWNVNAKGKDENLSSWLCADWHQYGPPDIVVVGFQEMVDLNAVNVAVENKSQQRSQFWYMAVRISRS